MYTQADPSNLPSITTYQGDFSHRADSLPPLPFCQEPCLYHNEGKLNPRCFPISLPIFPHRKRDSAIPIAAGFETDIHANLYKEHKKNKSRSENRSSKKSKCSKRTPEISIYEGEYQHSVPTCVLKELVHLHTYTPSSDLREIIPNHREYEESEVDSQRVPFQNTSVRYRQRVKNAHPENWQKIGCIWDKVQERKGFNCSERKDQENSKLTESGRLLSRPRINQHCRQPAQNNERSQKAQEIKKTFNERIPGYEGYKPQLPIEQSDKFNNVYCMQTTSQTYYKSFPKISYCLPTRGHNGPLSRLVTLTEPFNPFNKISNQRITVS